MKRLALLLSAFCLLTCAKHDPVVVGSKNFTESVILGELLAQKLESARCSVDRKLNMGGSLVCDAAVASGSLDAYVEYSGTALTAIGVATIAAAIGGGGLGTLIFRGVAMVDSKLILAGALPAAALALIADAVMTVIERRLIR